MVQVMQLQSHWQSSLKIAEVGPEHKTNVCVLQDHTQLSLQFKQVVIYFGKRGQFEQKNICSV